MSARVVLLATAALLGGCARYQPEPLSDARIAHATVAPDITAVLVRAGEMSHPLLPAIAVDPRAPLPVVALGSLAVVLDPDLRALRDTRAEAQAAVLSARVLPNPQLSAGLAIPLQPEEGITTGWTVGLDWDLVALATRSPRVTAAREEAAAVDLGIAWQEWQTALAATTAGCALVAGQARLALLDALPAQVAAVRTSLIRAQALHAATGAELQAIQAILNDAVAARDDAAQAVASAQVTLGRLLGMPHAERLVLRPLDAQAWMAALAAAVRPGGATDLDVPSALVRLAHQRLDLVGLAHGYASQEEVLRAAVLAQLPHIGMGGSVGRDTTGILSGGPGLTLDLPLFDRNQGPIAQARATRARLADEYMARLLAARADIAQAVADAADARLRLAHALDAAVVAQALAAHARAGLAAHVVDAPTAVAAMAADAQAQAAIITQEERMAEDLVALSAACGRWLLPLPGATPPAPQRNVP